MSLIKYRNPWSHLQDLQEQMNKIFELESINSNELTNPFDSQWAPRVDVKDTDDAIEITADLPGVKADDIEVHCEDHMITIKGNRKTETKESRDDYTRVERFSGSFCRRFSLPASANTKEIRAETKDGVLNVLVPKSVQSQPQKIKVESKD